jgi:hypothetical protein
LAHGDAVAELLAVSQREMWVRKIAERSVQAGAQRGAGFCEQVLWRSNIVSNDDLQTVPSELLSE